MNVKSRQLASRAPMLRRAASYDDLWTQIHFRTLDIPEQFNLGWPASTTRTRRRGR